MSIDELIDQIIQREGGYVDRAEDRGGPTKFGITLDTLRHWRGATASKQDIAELTRDEAELIYRTLYVKRPQFHRIEDQHLRELVVDSGVNHGTRRAARWMQEAAGVTADGKVGPVTLEAVNSGFVEAIYKRVLATRIVFYGQIVKRDPTQSVFIEGWLTRAVEFL